MSGTLLQQSVWECKLRVAAHKPEPSARAQARQHGKKTEAVLPASELRKQCCAWLDAGRADNAQAVASGCADSWSCWLQPPAVMVPIFAALRREVSSPCCAPAGQQPSLCAKFSCCCALSQQPCLNLVHTQLRCCSGRVAAMHVKEAEAEACIRSKANTTHDEALDSLVLGHQHPCRENRHVGLGLTGLHMQHG